MNIIEAVKEAKDGRLCISALEAQERKVCGTCKHNPPEKKWPCSDCDIREPADRWERREDQTPEYRN